MLKINCASVEAILVAFIRDAVRKNGFRNAIVGVSGGLDSAVVLALCKKALGCRHTFALLLPYRVSAKASRVHGEMACARYKVPYEVIDISPAVDAYFSRFPAKNKLQIGNKCARERMSVLYDFSVRKQALVAGTSNKSELLVGYSTQFGDSAAAFLPIGDLYKTQVYELARHLGIPEEIIERGFPLPLIRRIQSMIVNSQFKRTMPPVAKLHARTIGIDFRYLRDWNK